MTLGPDGGWTGPSERELRLVELAIRPFELVVRPRFHGIEALPADRPLLFVGNHQLLALDTPFLLVELWRRAIPVRPLADDFLFAWPPLGRLLEHFGMVQADPVVAAELFEHGACVLVYPGGAREAAKGGGEPFVLQWWDRLGFALLSLEHRCTIVTVAAVGIDDSVRVFFERDDYLSSPLGAVIDRLHVRHDLLPPVFALRRRPQLAFRFGAPIATVQFFGHDLESSARRLRGEVARALMHDLEWLRARYLAAR